MHVGADDQGRLLLTFDHLHVFAVHQDWFLLIEDSSYTVTVGQDRLLLTFDNLHGGTVNQDLFLHNKDGLYSVAVYRDVSCSPYYNFNVLIFSTYNIFTFFCLT